MRFQVSEKGKPDWLDSTPGDRMYNLETCDGYGNDESIDLTRAEYVALKEHLARMRGYQVEEEQGK